MEPARAVIDRLRLVPHPEGGWYRETHRSDLRLPAGALPDAYGGPRCAMTSILYLLAAGERSRRHRVRSEELWVHHGGDDLELRIESPDGEVARRRLGTGEGAQPQHVVPPGWWQSAEPVPGPAGWVLVGCIVAPGFEFEDFDMAQG